MQPPPPPGPGGAAGRPLGSRGARFLSRFVDGLILTPVYVLFFFVASLAFAGILATGVESCGYDGFGDYVCSEDSVMAAGVGGFVVAFVILLIGNAIMLAILAALTVRKGERNGQTLGRQLVNVRLVRTDGRPVDWSVALRREALFPTLLALPLWLGTLADMFWPLIDSRKRRLVDIWCGTEVLLAQGTAPAPVGPSAPPPHGAPAWGAQAVPPPPPGPFGGPR
ncbi:MAG: RDD family protein [Solirubrobacteraceae bacterium]|nr:RDD family protein [Solirubrobacteraceae bacterium]